MFNERYELTSPNLEAPDLVTTMPRIPSAPGMRAAETVVLQGRKAILDIVTPGEEDVLGWCCFARERHSDEWHRVREASGKYVIPVPDTEIEVLGFHRYDGATSQDEKIWRIYARNDVRSGIGADICLRLVVRSAAHEVIRTLPHRVSPMRSRVDVSTPSRGVFERYDGYGIPVLATSGT